MGTPEPALRREVSLQEHREDLETWDLPEETKIHCIDVQLIYSGHKNRLENKLAIISVALSKKVSPCKATKHKALT